jgi:1-acyl-sn-glycerol-3-phosphate acyltransferase
VTGRWAATVAAAARRALWRAVLTLTGGLRVRGAARLPAGPCVIVANHRSHADTAALIAALPARRQPAVAAAADYWFRGAVRRGACRALCAAFPVRRSGGGGADLAGAARLLAAGHDVIIFPEGSRSRDGRTGDFHRGAVRLAMAAGVPLVPAAIIGTGTLLPPSAAGRRPRRAAVLVLIGVPIVPGGVPAGVSGGAGEDAVIAATAEARARVTALMPGQAGASHGPVPAAAAPRDSACRVAVARFAGSRRGLLLVPAWAFGEALSWPLLPEVILAVLCVAAPKAGPRLAASAALGSVAGGAAGYLLASRGIMLPQPLTTARMHAAVTAQVAAHGAAAVYAQPLSGIPFKVYAATAGTRRAGLAWFIVASAQARGARILAAGMIMTIVAACAARLRRFFPVYLLALGAAVTGGLSAVFAAWS